MKKFLICIVLAIPLLFTYNIANATSDTNNIDLYTPVDSLSTFDINNPKDFFNNWVYQTSNSVVDSYIDSTKKYSVLTNVSSSSNYVNYTLIIHNYDSSTIGLCSVWRNSTSFTPNGGIGPCDNSTSFTYNSISFTATYRISNGLFYTNSTFSNQITSLADVTPTINNNVTTNFSHNWYREFIVSGTSDNARGFMYYKTNMEFISSPSANYHNRTITLINYDTNETILTYNTTMLFPNFVSYYYGTPLYLSGYKEVNLTSSDKYIILSDIIKGSVFVPAYAYNEYGARISYFDKELDSQPYTSYIDTFTPTPDGIFFRQDFDLSTYPNSDFILFSKYIYLEGEDNISYSIWVPDSSYDSGITITPNVTGGNDFNYTYKDSNGDIQNGSTSSNGGIAYGNPLLGSMFENFSSNTFGLTSIITAPLSLIANITSNTCNSLELPLPYVNSNLTLPCMTEIYSSYFGDIFSLYQTITFGLIAYWVCIKIFALVKDFKNPDHDEIEVLDL